MLENPVVVIEKAGVMLGIGMVMREKPGSVLGSGGIMLEQVSGCHQGKQAGGVFGVCSKIRWW
ncbi:hypothetical protein [Peribacillus kribbensis]|uniref:hypothetical protein n=1 Tax=Peribacillus kribbensis TaxID=356658 RepID=UPI00042A2C49|nr:hypothetical protein [Peribacillus kribbensis]